MTDFEVNPIGTLARLEKTEAKLEDVEELHEIRQADKQHRRRVIREALQAMIDGGRPEDCVSEDCAKQAIKMIARGQVPSVTINY